MNLDHCIAVETIASIPAMRQFAAECKAEAAPQSWNILALAVQLAVALNDKPLHDWAVLQGQDRPVHTITDEALLRLVLNKYPDSGMEIEGYLGHYVAGRVAEAAYLDGDLPRMERAVERLGVMPMEATTAINPETPWIIADVMCHFLRTGRFHQARVQEAAERLAPLEAQRLFLDVWRLRDGVSYGGKYDRQGDGQGRSGLG